MDIALETIDTFVFDYVYAKVLPYKMKLAPQVAKFLRVQDFSKSLIDRNTGFFFPEAAAKLATAKNPEFYGEPVFWKHAYDHVLACGSIFARDHIIRQIISFTIITATFGALLYLSFATLSYLFVFDRDTFNHPRFLKNQITLEITQALSAIPFMSLCTAPWFVAEVRGYSRMYLEVEKHGWLYLILQFPLFLMFTDCGVYLIHRGLHHKWVYKHLHKPHHKWIMPSPFASHAFHPLDGYFQSLPYHIFPFLLPLNKISYLILFTFINFWTIMIHDGEFLVNSPVINGTACHTVHHLYFNYNYGQFFTLWDRVGGSYRQPEDEFFDHSLRKDEQTIRRQVGEFEKIRAKEESADDRVYVGDTAAKKTVAVKRNTKQD
ncbi:hypothetical protein B0I72DRAFT_141348 [Yarrowia lipolytica]|jgi:lathosterol oxidase|uniref:YALI0D20878p n=2 Tax=Yarrowia lipolytica TaxID=4952 RepID=Q6C8C2_YARLI|nr:YALI0D20878p [Yarrowia lipolytica CLIB122]AOW04390.1 hypothetical protein YALI1_D26496g [Yarrowia lipolytica]KAB8285787.1 hypothetical protein BKA91DRAFT_132907 [Yarrowia lipolytica]KAE8171870.1 hypothetical protein BKA90DRAFT_138380 [Yarrowia lipolytica]KAJ8054127.1 hypothetical protein LXG23DRAFT_20749 [Yarrowia lipolytica]QNP97999.1 Delta(7)-sterol 5(6)-desaturase [Yarrowia lipolytica]|eukprot:XP_503090.1 YALI0D20878p [Yarrowia lipolytica CLIB122]